MKKFMMIAAVVACSLMVSSYAEEAKKVEAPKTDAPKAVEAVKADVLAGKVEVVKAEGKADVVKVGAVVVTGAKVADVAKLAGKEVDVTGKYSEKKDSIEVLTVAEKKVAAPVAAPKPEEKK